MGKRFFRYFKKGKALLLILSNFLKIGITNPKMKKTFKIKDNLILK
jgi:hypothetical protein